MMRFSTRQGLARRWLSAALVGAVLTVAGVSAVTYRYTTDPARIAEAFLTACREDDYARLHGLMDQAFQQAVSVRASSVLLSTLNTAMPRQCAIALAGYPSRSGRVDDRHLFHARVEATGVSPDSRSANAFLIVLTQGGDGRWRVAFKPTYESLYFTRSPGARVPDMGRMVAWAAGPRTPRLREWRGRN